MPPGRYSDDGYESQQVFDIDISRVVTEYRAQVLVDENGNRFVASFPEGVTKAVQYGSGLKEHSVYMSQFQLIPYNRVQEYFADQINVPVSEGSICNFNKEAFSLLADFETRSKLELSNAEIAHADETSINRNGHRIWLYNLSNPGVNAFYPHEKKEKRPWMSWGFYRDLKGHCAMITGNPIINTIVPTHYAMPII